MKTIFLLLALGAVGMCATKELSTSTEEDCPRRCAGGWQQMGSKCIKYFGVHRTFYAAERACRHAARKGHLISIHSSGQNHVVQAVVARGNCHRPSIWTGGQRIRGSRRFYWMDGSSWNYSSWGCEALDESCRRRICVQMNSRNGARWSQVSCRARRPYVCQYPLHGEEAEETQEVREEQEINAGVETKEEASAM
nr:PREDICTED: rheacalcin-2-like [Lepisosteus oculatus]